MLFFWGGSDVAELQMIMISQAFALVQGASWVERLMVGPLVVSLAVIAVAGTGLALLKRHVPLEAAFRLVLGCFIVFGASAFAHGLISTAQSAAAPKAVATSPDGVTLSQPHAGYDPYAGATAPVH